MCYTSRMKKSLLFMLCVGMSVSLCAAMKVSWNKITFTDAVSDADVQMGNRQYRKRLFLPRDLCVVAKGVDADSLARLVRLYPNVPRFEVRDCPWLTNLEVLAPLTNLTSLTISLSTLPQNRGRIKPLGVSGLDAFPVLERLALQGMPVLDLAPVGRCKTLKNLDFSSAQLPDLAPLGGLSGVTNIVFRRSTLLDFAPLAGLSALASIDFYAAKVPAEKWSSLGALRQVKSFRSGLTSMTSIAWVKELSQIESLSLFGEDIRDLSSLVGVKTLKSFTAASMRSSVDVSFARGCPALKELALPCCWVSRLEELRAASSLRALDLSEIKNGCDLAFASSLVNLESLTLDRSNVQRFDAVKGLPKLRHLSLRDVSSRTAITLKGLEACPQLASLTVSRGAFPNLEIGDVTHACQKNVTGFTLIQK